MGHLAVWKVLDEIITEFRKKHLIISERVMDDLKAAKTMINIVGASEGHGQNNLKIDEYLGSVEAQLITEAQKHFVSEHIDKWLKRLETANCKACDEGTTELRFIAGVPRDQKWIRVEPLTNLSAEKLKQFAKEASLSVSTQEDGRMIVYGQAENLKAFVNKMTTETNKTRNTT